MRIIRKSAAQNWLSGGGKLQFPLDFLPAGYRIESIFLCGDLTVTAPAAGVTSEEQTRLVDGIEQDRRLRTTGIGESAMDWCLNGKDIVRPAALAVGAGQAVNYFWPLSYRDPRGVSPNDASPATEFYKGQALDVYLKDPNTIVAGYLVTAGTGYLVVHLSDRPAAVVPQSLVKGYVEVIGKETKLPAGVPVDLVMVKNDGSAFTDAELGNIQLTLDGHTNILERARIADLAREFNYSLAAGGTQQGAGVEGEALPNSGSLPWVPLMFAEKGQKATKLPRARQQVIMTFDGTLAANIARVFYRYIEPQDEVQTAKAGAKLGIPMDERTVVQGKTATKTGLPVDGDFKSTHGILPRRFARAA